MFSSKYFCFWLWTYHGASQTRLSDIGTDAKLFFFSCYFGLLCRLKNEIIVDFHLFPEEFWGRCRNSFVWDIVFSFSNSISRLLAIFETNFFLLFIFKLNICRKARLVKRRFSLRKEAKKVFFPTRIAQNASVCLVRGLQWVIFGPKGCKAFDSVPNLLLCGLGGHLKVQKCRIQKCASDQKLVLRTVKHNRSIKTLRIVKTYEKCVWFPRFLSQLKNNFLLWLNYV